MNEMIDMMIKRRTIRRYKTTQLPQDALNEIVEAALHAPNAGGRQSAIMVVCQNTELNDELGKISRNVENLAGAKPGTVSSEQPSIIDDENIKSGFYAAPTVITLFAPKDNYNMTGDCFVAAENIVIAAQALGIGSCIVGRAYKTFGTTRGQEIQREWGIDEGFEARVHVALGYPAVSEPSYKPRKEGRVIRIL